MEGEHTDQKDGSCPPQDKAEWCEGFITLFKMALIEKKLFLEFPTYYFQTVADFGLLELCRTKLWVRQAEWALLLCKLTEVDTG